MSENDPNWEFNCPQFVDFTSNPHEGDDGADEWFERGKNVAIPSLESAVPGLATFVDRQSRPNDCSPMASPRMKLEFSSYHPSSPVMKSPVLKRLRVSGSSSAPSTTSCERPKWRRPPMVSALLNNARKPLHSRLLFGSKTQLHSNRNPMATICQNAEVEAEKPADESKQFDFVASLRQYDPPVNRQSGVLKPTHPLPFTFDQPVKKPSMQGNPFRSMAEQVIAFQKKTPLRFRTKKATATDSSGASASSSSLSMKSLRRVRLPRLLSMKRSRPIKALSHEQKEQLEVDEMKKFKFRAKPVNAAVLQEKAKLPEVERRPTTIVEPFNICADHRSTAASQAETSIDVPKAVEFVARPIPKGLFASPKLKVVQCNSLTNARSPPFLLKARAQERYLLEEERRLKEEPEVKEKSNIAVNAEPFVPKLDHKSTAVQPFTFEQRDKDRQKHKEQKICEVFEEEKRLREFHAKPLPNPCVNGLPKKNVLPSTTTEPFQLLVDERGAKKQTKWIEQMEQELLKQKEKACFKAKPCKVTVENPFIPQKTNRPLTTFICVDLHTEKRAKEREVFDAALKANDAEVEEASRRRAIEKEEEEQKLVASLRASIVHRAQPIHRYKEVHVEGSDRSPTNPQSPMLATKKRKRSS